MENSKLLKAYLIVSGLLLTVIGGATLLMPAEMKASAAIDLTGNVNLSNDVRAGAAMLLAMALLSLAGVFSKKLAYTSTLVSLLVFLSLGFGRALSMVADGMPVDGLVKATVLEFVLGLVGLFVFYKYKAK